MSDWDVVTTTRLPRAPEVDPWAVAQTAPAAEFGRYRHVPRPRSLQFSDGTKIEGAQEGLSVDELVAKLNAARFQLRKAAPAAASPLPFEGEPAAGAPKREVPEPLSPVERFTTGLADPVVGGAQLVAHGVPSVPRLAGGPPLDTGIAGRMDQYVSDREATYRARREAWGDSGIDTLRIAGDVASPVNYLPMSALGRIGLAPKAISAVSGALSGGLTPTEQAADFGREKLEQAGVGLIGGRLAHAAGDIAANIVLPRFREAAQALLDAGVKLTPGQMAGGAAKAAEDAAASVPVLGDAINSGRRRSIESFNLAAVNRALAPIGEQVPGHIRAGRELIDHAQQKLSDSYETLLPKLKFRVDQRFVDDVNHLQGQVQEMAADQVRQFGTIVRNRVASRMGPDGSMPGQTLKQVEAELTHLQGVYGSAQDGAVRQLGEALGDLKDTIRAGVERSNPDHAGELATLNRSFAMFARVRSAAAKRPTSGGVFTPSDLLQAVKVGDKTPGKAAFARGAALMQDFAQAGQDVLPSELPDSGTAKRLMTAGGAAYVLHHPGVTLGIGAGALPFTSFGMNALRGWATGLPATRKYLAETMRQGAPYAAPAGALAAQGMSLGSLSTLAPQSLNSP